MGVGRLAPHQVRARYAQALKEIPLPVRSFTGIDPGGLTPVGEAEIAGRRVQFGVLYAIPRLWITFPEHLPPILGFLTGFDGTAGDAMRTELHVTELDHLDWARQPGQAATLKRAAADIWRAAQRECEG
ncbi:hypothetical protein [Glycomyces tritici]|uniref:Uncharacterized protein n=1 Tax=Glycomyces tritici TaxID=2665176 RepID=A0ABT7YYJ4_9ACTN|nr:hypothetical protein [Glycomyces tritici]MDN3241841.1 hypothetical protein [Glycomyces tritici]MDN3243690.1 hypothetical protein [Glycomyces tritici]